MNYALLLAALLVAAPASAQTFQTAARPVGGTLTARSGDAAGALDLSLRAVSETGMDGCSGYVDLSAPDAVVEWGGGPLQITTRADFDATLVVARPDGAWACNDDGDGLQPVVDLPNAASGRYAVWVGVFADTEATGSAVTLVAGSPPPPVVPDVQARPTGGTVSVSAGFETQSGAVTQSVEARGQDPLSRADLGVASGFGCSGYIDASAPSLVVRYDAGQARSPLVIAAAPSDGMADLVVLVRTPAGRWSCNDDFDGPNPVVSFDDAAPGDYVVWVGTYSSLAQQERAEALVTVSETVPESDFGMDFEDMGPREPYSEGTYTPLQPDVRASVQLRVSDEPSEAATTVTSVTGNPISGASCSGYISTEATADVVMSGAGPLAISARSPDDHDLVMIVRTPDGRWFCSDDADGLNPGVQFGSADDPTVEAGTYRVWVGPFSDWNDGMMEDDMGRTGIEALSVTVRAERGELTVSVNDMDFGMHMGMDRPMFTDGTYAGTDLRADDAMQTLRLDGGPATAAVQAGGTLVNPVTGDACAGFVGPQPTFDVSAAAGELLRIEAASDDDDLVMVVRTPSGAWFCSDDAEGSNPAVETNEDGRHAVWVGTYSRRPNGATATATVSSAGTRM